MAQKFEDVAKELYDDPFKGVLIRRLNPDRQQPQPGDRLLLPTQDQLLLFLLEPESTALRRTKKQKMAFVELLQRRGS